MNAWRVEKNKQFIWMLQGVFIVPELVVLMEWSDWKVI
jgi:hypothetical protein